MLLGLNLTILTHIFDRLSTTTPGGKAEQKQRIAPLGG